MPKPLVVLLALVAVFAILTFTIDPLGLRGNAEKGNESTTEVGEGLDGAGEGPALVGSGTGLSVEAANVDGEPVGSIDLGLGGGMLTGIVHGEGEPLKHARVFVDLLPPLQGRPVRTREDGTYEVRGLPMGQHDVRASAEGFTTRTVVAPLLKETAEATAAPTVEATVETIDLVRRAANVNGLRVKVLDNFGRPVQGAKVLATTAPWDLHITMGPELAGLQSVRHGSATSDERGIASITSLASDQYNVMVSAEGLTTAAMTQVVVTEGRVRSLLFQLEAGQSISGKVLDAEGRPVKEALVMGFQQPTWLSSLASRTDDQGRFTLDGLGKGSYLLFASGGADGEGMSPAGSPSMGATIKLKGTGKLKGRVLNADGTPATVATVRPYTNGPFQYVYSMIHKVEDEEGRFELDLGEGQYDLRVQTPNGALAIRTQVPVKVGNDTEVEIQLPPSGKVTGVVTDEDGNHIEGAEVYLRMGGFPPTKSREHYARTDAEGAFEITGFTPGETLNLWADHAEFAKQSVSVTPTDAGARMKIQLARGASVLGTVRDAAGSPKATQQITLFQNFMEPRVTFTDANGNYRFAAVPEGGWQVRLGAFTNQSSGTQKGITVGATGDVRMDFDMAGVDGVVRGTVSRAGKPLAGAQVTIIDGRGAGQITSVKTDAQGNYEVLDVQPGRFTAFVQGADGASTTDAGSFPEGAKEARLDISLGTCAVRGLLVDPEGEPVAGAWVQIESTEEGGSVWEKIAAQVTSRNDGTFTATGLDAGRYRVRANHTALSQFLTGAFTVGEGQTHDVGSLNMIRGASITGRVTDDEGRAIEDATITLTDEAGRSVFLFSMSTTGSDGRYALEGVTPGRYTIGFEAKGYGRDSKPIEVTGSGASADGVLGRPGSLRVSVKDEAAYALEGARVALTDSSGKPVTKTLSLVNLYEGQGGTTGNDGLTTLKDLAPGTYRVSATLDGYAGEPVVVVVRSGETAGVELILRK